MFHLMLTGVTFLLITHSATASPVQDKCDTLQSQVDTAIAALRAAVPWIKDDAEIYAALANELVDVAPGKEMFAAEQVRDVICKLAVATSQKDLARALGVPYASLKIYYAGLQRLWRNIDMMEGIDKAAMTFTTLLVALDEAGYPNWPLTKTYDEWLTLVNQLVDEVGSDFLQWLISAPFGTPIVDNPANFARQLTDATSLSDFARRVGLSPRSIDRMLNPFAMVINIGTVDETIVAVHSIYALIEYAASTELFNLPLQ